MLEFTAGVLSGEPPVYDGASIVALAFERGNLLPQQHFIADPAVQTLSAEDAQLDLGHVQPASMRGSVVKLQALGYTTRFGRSKCFVERAQEVFAMLPAARVGVDALLIDAGVAWRQAVGA